MAEFDWDDATRSLAGFGGDEISLFVNKTGMPFFDVLQLYGAIDLFFATREDIEILDCGNQWGIIGRARSQRVTGRVLACCKNSKIAGRKGAQACKLLREEVTVGVRSNIAAMPLEKVKTAPDPLLQSGIRGLSPLEYDSFNASSGPCKASIPVSQAILASAGERRVESAGGLSFLPVFDGRLDLERILNPFQIREGVSDTRCCQALILLHLRVVLCVEGFDQRLSSVVYKKTERQASDGCSGLLRIDSTAVGRIGNVRLLTHFLTFYRDVLKTVRTDKSFALHSRAIAGWILHPMPTSLTVMISSMEFLVHLGRFCGLSDSNSVKEVFNVTHDKHAIDFRAVERLAQAVSSAIFTLGKSIDDDKKRRQAWYNQVVALRNSPTKEAFRHRVLTLIEQSRAVGDWVGTDWRDEAYDPAAIFESMGNNDRRQFEAFRDCFRMYLIQSTGQKRDGSREGSSDDPNVTEESEDIGGEDQ